MLRGDKISINLMQAKPTYSFLETEAPNNFKPHLTVPTKHSRKLLVCCDWICAAEGAAVGLYF